MRAADDEKEQIDVVLVDARQAVQHDDFRIEAVRFVEQRLLEGFLLLDAGEHVLIVVFGQNAVAVAVQNEHGFDGEQCGFLWMSLHTLHFAHGSIVLIRIGRYFIWRLAKWVCG